MSIPEEYSHPTLGTKISFIGLPNIQLISIAVSKNDDNLIKLAKSVSRRYFHLVHDWAVSLKGFVDKPSLDGEIIVPKSHNGEEIEYDGASIPFPWLISFLSVGIIRPLGVLFIGSLVHDFAFKFGYVLVREKNTQKITKIHLQRHEADDLFRDMTSTLSGLRPVGWIAWLAVRLGWFSSIKYAGKKRTGKPPYLAAIIAAAIISLIVIAFCQLQLQSFLLLLSGLTALLFTANIVLSPLSSFLLKRFSSK